MFRFLVISAIVLVLVLYLNRRRLREIAYTRKSVTQNRALRAQFLRNFFFLLGRIARIGLLKRFFRP